MRGSRFVFLSLPAVETELDAGVDAVRSAASNGVRWTLVSPNNRPLGRAKIPYPTYAECLASVRRIRDEHDRLKPVPSTMDSTGAWVWRLDLDGEIVAVSSRSYLRLRECSYNMERFLEAVPVAGVVEGARITVPISNFRR